MERRVRLNVRAATKRPDTLWHVDAGWALFAGPLGRNAQHAHSTAVYLAGLYDSFRLRVAGEPWRTCRAAVIRAGTPYEFDVGGAPLGVLYLEPNKGGADALAALVPQGEELSGALVGDGDSTHMRALFEHRSDADGVCAGADDLLAFSRRYRRRDIDPRIARAVDRLQASDELLSMDDIATAAGLSTSRFQHLFTAEVGVPFRRYRGWQRLRNAIRCAAAGASLTEAAHAAGFADQAHFSRAFRAAFGAPPSRGI
jgi:AraC-like DNA-binding protein